MDFEKASELVRLDFLNYMLHRIGLCDKWIRWIKFCLSYASILVLVNGSPTEEFFMNRGLRQGNPLAPFLFLLVAKGLSDLVREAEKKDLFDGVHVGSDNLSVPILQFVTPSTPHIYFNKGIKIQILIKSIFKTFLNTSFSNG